MPPARKSWLVLVGFAVALNAGCSKRPTYPQHRLEESVHTLLAEDGLHASAVRLLEGTLAIQLAHPGALLKDGEEIGIGPAFEVVSRQALTALHRVLLSSDADVRFYVLLLSDPQIPGAYLTLVRYMDDVRRASANMLDIPEMFARTIFELNYVGPQQPLTLEQYLPREIRLEEFLSWQLARRIQQALVENLELPGVAHISRCGGTFQNGEFAFTLDVVPLEEGVALDEPTLQSVFHTATTLIAKVLSSYRFEGFKQIRLIHPLTGRHLVLPKTRLEIFR